MKESSRETCWKGGRRLLSITAIIFLGLVILLATLTTTSRSVVHMRGAGESSEDGSINVFGTLHHVMEFPRNYMPSDNDANSMSNVNYRGTKKLPRAIIIGAKKAGTRALLEFIRVHPNVRAAGHEVHFFDKNYSKGLEWYREMMPTSIEGQITIEKTPSYLVTEKAPEHVYDLDPGMKIIIVFKDPVDRAISDFTQSYVKHKVRRDYEDSVLKDTWARSFENSVFKDSNYLVVNATKPSISTGVYSKHVTQWLDFFPLSQFCFINGENLVKNPAAELKKLQDFLQLKRVITEDHFYFNSTKGFPCMKKREASGIPHCLGNGKGRPHPEISDEAKVSLYDYFEPFNLQLYRMIGINFNWERRKPFKKYHDASISDE